MNKTSDHAIAPVPATAAVTPGSQQHSVSRIDECNAERVAWRDHLPAYRHHQEGASYQFLTQRQSKDLFDLLTRLVPGKFPD